MTRPLVGIAGYRKPVDVAPGYPEPALVLPERYISSVRSAGGDPVVIDALHERLDAVILAGGGDVDPAVYGQDRSPEVAGVDPDRDRSEIALASAAIEAGLPLLCICRGAQVLNVALGGTLVQHLVEGVHRDGATKRGLEHALRAESGSRVAQACGTSFAAWSSHHQAVDRIGRGLRAVAWAPDGLVEAVELERGWTVGVQWHPEVTAERDHSQLGLFRSFIAAAASGSVCL